MITRELTVPELAAILADTLARLSPTRVGVVSDQLRAILQSQSARHDPSTDSPRRHSHSLPDDLIAIAAFPDDLSNRSVIALAMLAEQGDTATIMHVDWAKPGDPGDLSIARQAATALGEELTRRFDQRSIKFVQWATDPTDPTDTDQNDVGLLWWPTAMGYAPIGTLDYLAIDAEATLPRFPPIDLPKSAPVTSLKPIDSSCPEQSRRLNDLVRLTYQESMDCPGLERFRDAEQILQSYRSVPSFAPDLWFTLHTQSDSDGLASGEAIGCCFLAKHSNSETKDLVLELVYMGIVPSSRGLGLGSVLMHHVAEICELQNASRLVLAVDRDNRPARLAYQRFGMTPLFGECVWVRSL